MGFSFNVETERRILENVVVWDRVVARNVCGNAREVGSNIFLLDEEEMFIGGEG